MQQVEVEGGWEKGEADDDDCFVGRLLTSPEKAMTVLAAQPMARMSLVRPMVFSVDVDVDGKM